MVIKRVEPTSCAKVAGILYVILGVGAGAIVSAVSLLGGFASGHPERARFGVGAIVVFPFLYGAVGFVTSLVGAWLYNLVAEWVGGVEIDTSQ